MVNKIQSEVMDKIKSGKIGKRPSWIYKLAYVLEYTLLAILGLMVVFLSSAIIYFITVGEIYTNFNFNHFLYVTPWETVIVIIFLFLVILILFANISLHYRLGWLKIVLYFIILVCVFAALAEICDLHSKIQNNIFLLRYYEGEGTFRDNRTNFVKGEVETVDSDNVVVKDTWGDLWQVKNSTDDINFAKTLEMGSSIKIIGEKKAGVVKIICIEQYEKLEKLSANIKCSN